MSVRLSYEAFLEERTKEMDGEGGGGEEDELVFAA